LAGFFYCKIKLNKGSSMTHFIKTEKNRVKRIPERGQYDRETIYRILDEALI